MIDAFVNLGTFFAGSAARKLDARTTADIEARAAALGDSASAERARYVLRGTETYNAACNAYLCLHATGRGRVNPRDLSDFRMLHLYNAASRAQILAHGTAVPADDASTPLAMLGVIEDVVDRAVGGAGYVFCESIIFALLDAEFGGEMRLGTKNTVTALGEMARHPANAHLHISLLGVRQLPVGGEMPAGDNAVAIRVGSDEHGFTGASRAEAAAKAIAYLESLGARRIAHRAVIARVAVRAVQDIAQLSAQLPPHAPCPPDLGARLASFLARFPNSPASVRAALPLPLYAAALTHGTVMCEYFEFAGDAVANKVVCAFVSDRLAGIAANTSVVYSNLTKKLKSTAAMVEYARTLGMSDMMRTDGSSTQIEDVFEAFVGITHRVHNETLTGLGYAVCRDMLDTALAAYTIGPVAGRISIEYRDIYDPVTQVSNMVENIFGADARKRYEVRAEAGVYSVQIVVKSVDKEKLWTARWRGPAASEADAKMKASTKFAAQLRPRIVGTLLAESLCNDVVRALGRTYL